MFSRTNMRFPNLFLYDIIAPWFSQTILFTFLFHEGDLKSSAGRVWVTRPALFVFTCLPVRPASRRRSAPASRPYRRRCARPSRYAHRRSDRARTAARRRPALRRKIRDTPSCVSYSLVRVAIQNFLKNIVISMVSGFRTTKFLACNFIFSPQIQGDC